MKKKTVRRDKIALIISKDISFLLLVGILVGKKIPKN